MTGVVSDKTASFTFSDEYNNRMEGTIEFQNEALKVVIKESIRRTVRKADSGNGLHDEAGSVR